MLLISMEDARSSSTYRQTDGDACRPRLGLAWAWVLVLERCRDRSPGRQHLSHRGSGWLRLVLNQPPITNNLEHSMISVRVSCRYSAVTNPSFTIPKPLIRCKQRQTHRNRLMKNQSLSIQSLRLSNRITVRDSA